VRNSSETGGQWRYARAGKFLICLDQPVQDVVRYLWLGYAKNKLGSIGLPRHFGRAALKRWVLHRLRRSKPADHLELPAFGHLGMQVHGGYKLFDLASQVVTKVFGSTVDARNAEQEITASRQASAVAAAPRFICSDPGLKWYREEYVRGVHATDPEFRAGVSIPDLYPDVETCLFDLVRSASPIRVNSDEHINALAEGGYKARWIDAGGDPNMVDEFAEYIEALRGWLTNNVQKPHELQLVLTHGDFSLVNAISTGGGLRFIDWEGITRGGLYSDIYHFLFVERYYDRVIDNFLDDVSSFVANYHRACLDQLPELQEAAEIDLTFARRLYYLERVRLMLDREVSANIGQVIIKSIDMYRQFDRDLGDDEL
jgi:hypothetical protein